MEIHDTECETKKRVVDEIHVTETNDRNKRMRQTYLNADTWLGNDMIECVQVGMEVNRETVKRRNTINEDANEDSQKRRKTENIYSDTHVRCAVENHVRFKRSCQSPSPTVPHTDIQTHTLARQPGKKQKINHVSQKDFHLAGPTFGDPHLLT